MSLRLQLFLLFISLAALALGQLPTDFVDIVVCDNLDRPVAFDMDDNGQSYILDKSGLVQIVNEQGNLIDEPLLDLREEVGNWGDHGAIGIVLHPNFLNNGYIYLSYTVDRHHLFHFGTASYQADSSLYNQATIGRVTRFTLDANQNFQQAIEGSRQVIIGKTKETGFPILMASHGIGDVIFGEDGTLFISCGDAGSFLENDFGNASDTYHAQAIEDGILREDENLGAFRAQYINSLNGKIVRVDAETGLGLPSNPFYDSSDPNSPASKVWALGLRNPFRMCLKPGTGDHDPALGKPGTIYLSDVGANKWEELNVCAEAASNFGWPIYEGLREKIPFYDTPRVNPSAPNPEFGNNCSEEFYTFQELLKLDKEGPRPFFPNPCNSELNIADSSTTFVLTPPAIAWANKLSNPPRKTEVRYYSDAGFARVANTTDPESLVYTEPFWGYSAVAGVFYDGENFPEEYHGAFFAGDYEWWIRSFRFDEFDELFEVTEFHNSSPYLLDMQVGPNDGFLYYINFQSQLHRIEYGGNAKPVAKIVQSQGYGPGPLTVQFDASSSFDPDGSIASYYWTFGDGFTSNESSIEHTFTTINNIPESFNVELTVIDNEGSRSTATTLISVNNTPPNVSIKSIVDGSFYALNGPSILPLEANVMDLESNLEDLSYEWQTYLQHNTHDHQEVVDTKQNTQTLIEPAGCNGEVYWYRVTLKVTDPQFLSGTDTVDIFPNCDAVFSDFLELEARVTDSAIQVIWETQREEDLDFWEVEFLNNLPQIRTVGQSPALGNNSQYVIEDMDPEMGTNFYRLKMHKPDGTYEFSDVVSADFPPDPLFRIGPNPANTFVEIGLREVLEKVRFTLYASNGKEVFKDEWEGTLSRKIDTSFLSSGIYFYSLINGEKNYEGKIMIHH